MGDHHECSMCPAERTRGHPDLFSQPITSLHDVSLGSPDILLHTYPYGWSGVENPVWWEEDWGPTQKGQEKEGKICSLKNKAV